MGKGVCPIYKELVQEFQTTAIMPTKDFTFLFQEWSANGEVAYFTFNSDLIPETVNGELPELMVIMESRIQEDGSRSEKLKKIIAHGQFEPGKKIDLVILER